MEEMHGASADMYGELSAVCVSRAQCLRSCHKYVVLFAAALEQRRRLCRLRRRRWRGRRR